MKLTKSVFGQLHYLAVFSLFVAFFGCSIPTNAQDVVDSARTTNGPFAQWGYYTFRMDLRLCPAPYCGGAFVRQVNLDRTPCIDGVFRKECYVYSIDWDRLKLNAKELNFLFGNSNHLLVRGRILPVDIGTIGEFGVLEVLEVFVATSNDAPQGDFVGLRDNGIVCPAFPCFSVDRFVLNKPLTTQVSSIDLNQTGATEEQVATALEEIHNEGLIAVGRIENGQIGPAGTDIRFVASRFYLRYRSP